MGTAKRSRPVSRHRFSLVSGEFERLRTGGTAEAARGAPESVRTVSTQATATTAQATARSRATGQAEPRRVTAGGEGHQREGRLADAHQNQPDQGRRTRRPESDVLQAQQGRAAGQDHQREHHQDGVEQSEAGGIGVVDLGGVRPEHQKGDLKQNHLGDLEQQQRGSDTAREERDHALLFTSFLFLMIHSSPFFTQLMR